MAKDIKIDYGALNTKINGPKDQPLKLDYSSLDQSLTNDKSSGLTLDYSTIGDSSGGVKSRTDSPDYIPTNRRYKDGDGWFEKAINALDYVGNVSRSAIDGLPTGDALKYGWQAATHKRYTDPGELRRKAGIDDLNQGKGFDSGDVVDFVGDVATDIVTDPLNLLSLGTVGLAKSLGKSGAKTGTKALAKAGSRGAKELVESAGTTSAKMGIPVPDKVGEIGLDLADKLKLTELKAIESAPVDALERGLKEGTDYFLKKGLDAEATARNLLDPGVGFMYGVGTSDTDDSLLEKLGRGLAGAASIPAIRHVGAPVAGRVLKGGKLEGEIANKAANAIEKRVDPLLSKLKGQYDKALKPVDDLTAKLDGSASKARQSESQLGKFLKGNEDAVGVFGSLADGFVRRIHKAESTIKNADGSVSKVMKPVINSITKTNRLVQESAEIMTRRKREILEGKIEPFKDLDPVEQQTLFKHSAKYHQELLSHRDKLWSEWMKKNHKKYGIKDPETPFGKLKDNEIIAMGDVITRKAVDEKMPEIMAKAEKDLGNELFEKYKILHENNYKHVEEMNNFRTNVAMDKLKKSGDNSAEKIKETLEGNKKVQGLPTQTPVITAKEASETIDDLDRIFEYAGDTHRNYKAAGTGRNLAESSEDILGISTANRQLSANDAQAEIFTALDQYAGKEARKFLSDKHLTAISELKSYKNSDNWLLKSIGMIDELNGFMKRNLLYASTSWLVNNFWDNLMKSYVQGGLFNAIDTGVLSHFNKKLRKDIDGAFTGKSMGKSELTEIYPAMVKYGLADEVQLKNLQSDQIDRFMKSEEDLAKIKIERGNQGNLRKLSRVLEKKWSNLLEQTTGRAGSYLEVMGKATTFKNTLDMLKKDPTLSKLPIEELERRAAKVTEDTFFNYNTVDHFEKSLKRILPFYSFYKANSLYWASVATDPVRMARLSNLQAVFDNIGEPLNEFDKASLPSYFKNKNARKIGSDSYGDRFAMVPMFSAYDAIKMGNFDTAMEEVWGKVHPVAKGIHDVVRRQDSFTKQDLFPSEKRSGQTHLYSRGFSYYFGQEMLDSILQTDDIFGITLTEKGSPVTTSDKLVAFDKIMGTLIPGKQIADQISSSVGKVEYQEREGWSQSLINRALPVKQSAVTPAQRAINLRFNNMRKKAEQEENRGDREAELRKRLGL